MTEYKVNRIAEPRAVGCRLSADQQTQIR